MSHGCTRWTRTYSSSLRPPSADTLAWDYHFYEDGYPEHDDWYGEAPREWPLSDVAQSGFATFDDARWSAVEEALRSPLLFETPVTHFFVRAFLSESIDEFLADLTTIEAALGQLADHRRPKRDPYKKLGGATARVAARIAALLGDRSDADLYTRLFDVRSCYVHGRAMGAVSSKEKAEARSLARRVVDALIRANKMTAPVSREEFLSDLLNRGASMLKAPPAARW